MSTAVKYDHLPLHMAHWDWRLHPGPDDKLQRILLPKEVQHLELEPVKMKTTAASKEYQMLH